MRLPTAALVAAVVVALPFAVPGAADRFLIAQFAALALAATGLGFVSGVCGQLSLGHGALMGIGAYTSALLALKAGWPFAASAGAGIAATFVVGLVFAAPSLRVGGQYLALVTVALAYIAFQAFGQAESLTGGFAGLPGIPPPEAFGRVPGTLGIALAGTVPLALAVLASWAVRGAAPGRAAAAVRASERGAMGCGVEPFRTKLAAFAFSSVLAGAGGVLYAHIQGLISPDAFDLRLSLLLLSMVIIGGARTPVGPAIGAALVVLPRTLSAGFTRYELAVFGVLALALVILRPQGLAGGPTRRRRPRVEAARFAEEVPLVEEGATFVGSGISVRFGGLVALEHATLEVFGGTIHGLVGPNGSGKTTLVDACTGLLPRGGGSVTMNGHRVPEGPSSAAVAGIARTFQEPVPFPDLRCLEVVMLGATGRLAEGLLPAALGGYRRLERDLRGEARELLETVGLAGLERSHAGTLSFGEAKRLELARALAARPRVLFLDEPAAGLVPGEVVELARFLRGLRAWGLTVVVVEHHLEFLRSLADQVTVLDAGRVIATGPPDLVRSDPAVVEAYLGAPGGLGDAAASEMGHA